MRRQQATARWELARAERRRHMRMVLVGLGQALAVVLCGYLFLLLLFSL